VQHVTRRKFAALGGAAAVALNSASIGPVFAGAAAKSATAFDPAIHVNPDLRDAIGPLLKWSKGSLSQDSLPIARRTNIDAPPLAEPRWTERSIPGPKGAPDVRVYIVNASTQERLRPVILHMHGGGFVVGEAKNSVHSLQQVAAALDCVIVTVDYRLAPETHFPGSLEDNYAALKWLYEKAVELGADKSKIAVMGESSGGGHAAMLAIAARDRGEVPIRFQALIEPMLDDRTGSTRNVPAHIGALVWNSGSNRFGWTSLLGVPAGSSHVPHGAVPARVDDLSGLPATFIGVGSIDLFVNEDLEYAQRLIQVGVPTELIVVPGAFHGFQSMVPNSPVSKRFLASVNEALARAFAGA
jgi:acetyl esterase/lipase